MSEMARPKFEIFRRADAIDLDASGIVTSYPPEAGEAAGMMAAVEAGIGGGYTSQVLYSAPNFSLVYLWYKSGFPLPRHAHDCDCLYVVVGGTLRIGTEDLGPGDGFFVGADVPYAYTAGDQGVEVIEFRSTGAFDIRLMAAGSFWDKAAVRARDRREAWTKELVSPSGMTGSG